MTAASPINDTVAAPINLKIKQPLARIARLLARMAALNWLASQPPADPKP